MGARTIGALRFHGRPHWIEDFQRPADEVLAGARAWIEEDDPRPWFCFINMYDVHWPYLPGEEAQEHLLDDYSGPFTGFGTRSNDLYRTGYAPTTEDKRHLTELYEAEIWELDRQVAAFLEAIDVQNGRTGVVLTSDHGEAFGEADVWEHDDIYEPQVRIPLIVRGPGLNPPRGRVSEYVSGVDVAPTLLGMAGVEIPAAWPGLDLLSEAPSAERIILVEDRDHMEVDDVRLALYRGNFKLQREGCGEDAKVRLYDLSSDPIAERDISRRHPELTAELLGELERRSGAFDCSEGERISGTISGGNAAALSGLGYAGDGSEPKPERRRQEAPDDEVDPPPAPPAGGR